MLKGLVEKLYNPDSADSPPQTEEEGVAVVHIWLRAGYAQASIEDLVERLEPLAVDVQEFIEDFNERSYSMAGQPVPVIIYVFENENEDEEGDKGGDGDGYSSYEFEFGRISRIKPPLKPAGMDPYTAS